MHGRAGQGRRPGARASATACWPTTWPPRSANRAAHAGLVLAALLEQAAPGEVVAVVSLADGADVLVFRTTDGPGRLVGRPTRWPTRWRPAGRPALRQVPDLARAWSRREPPRRPEPERVSVARPPGATRTGSSASSAAEDRASGCRPPAPVAGVDDGRRRRRDGPGRPWPTPRPPSPPSPSTAWPTRPARPIVFAVRRLRRRRPAPGGADRRRPRRRGHRRPGGDDLPQAVHGRRHPRLLLEGPAGPATPPDGTAPARTEEETQWASHGIKDRVAIVGMGCTRFAEHWDKGLDDLIVDAAEDTFASAGVTKDDVDAFWFGTAQSGHERHHPGPAAPARGQAGDPGRELLRHRVRGAARRAAYAVASGAYDVAMAIGVEKVKDSGYQGLNAFPIPNDGTGPHADRGRHVLDGRPRLRPEVRRRRGRADRGAGPHRVEEPPERRPQPPGPVPQGGLHRDDLRLAPGGRATSACSTAPAWPTARPRPSSCGPRTPTGTPTQPLYIKALSLRGRQRRRA